MSIFSRALLVLLVLAVMGAPTAPAIVPDATAMPCLDDGLLGHELCERWVARSGSSGPGAVAIAIAVEATDELAISLARDTTSAGTSAVLHGRAVESGELRWEARLDGDPVGMVLSTDQATLFVLSNTPEGAQIHRIDAATGTPDWTFLAFADARGADIALASEFPVRDVVAIAATTSFVSNASRAVVETFDAQTGRSLYAQSLSDELDRAPFVLELPDGRPTEAVYLADSPYNELALVARAGTIDATYVVQALGATDRASPFTWTRELAALPEGQLVLTSARYERNGEHLFVAGYAERWSPTCPHSCSRITTGIVEALDWRTGTTDWGLTLPPEMLGPDGAPLGSTTVRDVAESPASTILDIVATTADDHLLLLGVDTRDGAPLWATKSIARFFSPGEANVVTTHLRDWLLIPRSDGDVALSAYDPYDGSFVRDFRYDGITEIEAAVATTLSPDGRFLLVAGYSTDAASQLVGLPTVDSVAIGYHLPEGPALVQARLHDDADADLLAVSGDGTARSRTAAVSADGDSHAYLLSVSGTGYAGGCGALLQVCGASVSGFGDSQGLVAASGTGRAHGLAAGASGTGDAEGFLVAASGTGDAHAFAGYAVSVTGDADTYYQPVTRVSCVAVSVTGDANRNEDLRPDYFGSACRGVSVLGKADYFSAYHTPQECAEDAQRVHVCDFVTWQGMGLLWFLP